MLRNCLIATLFIAATVPATAAEIRLCEREIRTVPLSDERGVQSALIQGFAVVNRGPEPVKLTGVVLQLKQEGQIRDTRRLLPPDIARAVRQAPQIAAIAQVFPYQFCNGAMLDGARLATSEQLGPGEALVFTHQPFAWQGARDQLEISAITEREGLSASDLVTLDIDQGASKTKLLFPIVGRSFVGVAASLHTPHRWVGIEEFGYDILMLTGDGMTYRGKGTRLSDYAAFGKPVRAVADGDVIAVLDGTADNEAMLKRPAESDEAYFVRLQNAQLELLAKGMASVLGNHVVIGHGNGEYSIYAHLKLGSVNVEAGKRVLAGQTIGALGSSGNSTEPHLHFQMCDSPDISTCRPIPANFTGFRLPWDFAPRSIQSGDIVETLQ